MLSSRATDTAQILKMKSLPSFEGAPRELAAGAMNCEVERERWNESVWACLFTVIDVLLGKGIDCPGNRNLIRPNVLRPDLPHDLGVKTPLC